MIMPDRIGAWDETPEFLEERGIREGEWSTEGFGKGVIEDFETIYLRATPAREHAEELADALREVGSRIYQAAEEYNDALKWEDCKHYSGEVTVMEWVLSPVLSALAKLEKDT